jgi:putative flippase GtrA
VVTYVGNRHWSFKHRAGDGGTREYVTFGVLTVIGLLITLAFVGIGHYVIRLQGALAFNLFANVLGTGAATVFRFWAYRRYVFNATAPASGRPALQVPVAFREAA